jgi:PAS domain S-box-containing protein
MDPRLPDAPAAQRSRLPLRYRVRRIANPDRLLSIGPLITVVLFLTAVGVAMSFLRFEEIEREQETVTRDVEYAQQRMRLRLLTLEEHLMRAAQVVAERQTTPKAFKAEAATLLAQSQELVGVQWLDANLTVKAQHVLAIRDTMPSSLAWTASAQQLTRQSLPLLLQKRRPTYVPAPLLGQLWMVMAPIQREGEMVGVLRAALDLETLRYLGTPSELGARLALALTTPDGQALAGTLPPVRRRLTAWLPLAYQVSQHHTPLGPMGGQVWVHGQAYRVSSGVIAETMVWVVGILSALTVWFLLSNWRQNRRRMAAQRALQAESSFRRAMEDSMPTGMRALDMAGRITYVNPAFCRMTGWSEAELLGCLPPFPYWPKEDRGKLMSRLKEELQGQNLAGSEIRVQRKDGSVFYTRMYVSPLVSPTGEQTGWMTSVTDITEPKRIREELFAAHERFTTVLESLDAAVSVANLGSQELLFANRLYRQWFGHDTNGHHRMVMQAQLSSQNAGQDAEDADDLAGLPAHTLVESSTGSAEVHMQPLNRWLEVRSRYLTWVDGRLAQIVIATDISERRRAQALAEQQADQAQAASRLITMGEMASSVAHELNQPLTAISNYCNGLIARVKSRQIADSDLLTVLDKTSHQAQRAGQIISRIRSFVRRSEPRRQATRVEALVSNALELAEIDARRHAVRLNHYVAARLPEVHVDPILIEQVLINLIKNGADSIEQAQRPAAQREVELAVRRRLLDEQDGVEFSVRDTGGGIASEDMDRVYEAFFSTKAEGLGLGLKLCRSIVESHGGRLQVSNLYNNGHISGCCFTFWLPLQAAAVGAPPASPPISEESETP